MDREEKPDELIICPLCHDLFNSPKSLLCLHTFCKVCLHTYMSKELENNGNAVCPVCHSSVGDINRDKYDDWLNNLPSNFMVNSLMDREKSRTGNRNCEVCEQLERVNAATSYCVECCEAYCDQCSQNHTVLKMLRKHRLLPVDEVRMHGISSTEEFIPDCLVHINKKLELFCFDHEMPCCITCMTIHHRGCQNVQTLVEAANMVQKDTNFIAFTDRISKLINSIKEQLTSNEKKGRELMSQLSKVENQAQRKKEEMIAHIEALYKTFEEGIQTIKKQYERDDQSEVLSHKMLLLQNFLKAVDKLKPSSSNIAIFLEYQKMKGKENEVSTLLDQYIAKSRPESIEYIPSETARNFDSIVTSLGETEIRVINPFQRAQVSIKKPKSHNLKEILTIQEKDVRFTDAVFLDSDTVISVDDSKNCIWAFNINGTCMSRSDLPCRPWAVTVAGSSDAAITLRERRMLQFFTFHKKSKKLNKKRTIILKEEPLGIDFSQQCLFVTFSQKIMKLKLDGTTITEMSIPGATSSLHGISSFKNNVIVGDQGYDRKYDIHVINLDANPRIQYQRKFQNVASPVGVATDQSGNIYVAGFSSHNVVKASEDGAIISEILSNSAGFKWPMGIDISHDGKRTHFVTSKQNNDF
ncbi:hypothetical protein FSP39_003063 [Pinctada imbricata]|uniref:TRIM56 n=1 Tax=Pinctada imbricata TaxID=66713 RepID=A0AA88Y2Y2_PINIB|nr:hypothetical protein FSP39_003063 [Pinctada imbricata]